MTDLLSLSSGNQILDAVDQHLQHRDAARFAGSLLIVLPGHDQLSCPGDFPQLHDPHDMRQDASPEFRGPAVFSGTTSVMTCC